MTNAESLQGLALLALAALAVRLLGFITAGRLPATGFWPRLIEAAPGNLFVAFVTVGILTGGIASLAGVACAIAVAMRWRGGELLPLLAGAGAVAVVKFL